MGETILVIEDNEALREGLVVELQEARGYRVDSAADGREGMRKALATRPDLIVLDLMLPGSQRSRHPDRASQEPPKGAGSHSLRPRPHR